MRWKSAATIVCSTDRGLLGLGVADSTRYDPQAKSLGEHLRAQHLDVPTAILR